LRVLDLGCGTGSSTRVLAHYCPAGSRITGYELAEPILAYARRRDYRHQSGAPVRVDFVCQGVTEPFPELDRSVDLINASGIVGHHLKPETIGPLLSEMRRILKSDGVAMLDIGPTLRGKTLRRIMEGAGFGYLGRYRCWFGDWNGQMVFCRRATDGRNSNARRGLP
jgi:SAM-dependent methyltransferase